MEAKPTSELIFYVNGKKVIEQNPDPEWTLTYFLRNKLRLCGTKEGCGEGGCGVCTVMLSKIDRKSGKILNSAINSCLTPLVSVHGCAIVTAEGIGNTREGLHPVQERIAKSHGTQCGFCTPGMVMSMYTLLRNNEKPTRKDLEDNFHGNLCRCTGYRPILQGFKTFCGDNGGKCCMDNTDGAGKGGSGCCQKIQNETIPGATSILYDESEFKPYHPSQDPIFPPALKLFDTLDRQELLIKNERIKWFKPNRLDSALKLKSKYLDTSVFVAGNTALGVDAKFKGRVHDVFIQITGIPELTSIVNTNHEFILGSGTTFAQMAEFCKLQSDGVGVVSVLEEMLESFAGPQIRNMATIGGNIICANPSSHLNIILMACGATVTLLSKDGRREIPLDEEFFKNSPLKVLKLDEILISITIPKTSKDEFIWFAKQSRRKVNDLAIVNSCMRIRMCPTTQKITLASLVYGGVGSTTKIAKLTSNYLIGKEISAILVDEACAHLETDFVESVKSMEGMHSYRLSLTKTFFFKFYLAFTNHLIKNGLMPTNLDSQNYENTVPKKLLPSHGSQLFEIRPDNQPLEDLVGRPFAHVSALRHATGEAVYVNDIPLEDSHLVGSFVYSTKAYAKLVSIDPTEALALDGVVAFFDAKSLTTDVHIGFGHDEKLFAEDTVICVGQVLGFLVAKDQMTADRGVRLVKVNYEEISPPILTIEDAIKHESYLDKQTHEFGNVENAFKNCTNILEGEMKVGGQEHFYMETQSCVAIPKEEDELEVISATQSTKDVQIEVAAVLGIPANRVIVRTKRVGGAFGGKESGSHRPAIAAALAAHKLRVPVRCILNRREDMESTGSRHPALFRFKVGFHETGKIEAIQLHVYLNGGCTLDLSQAILANLLMSADLAYNIPNWKFHGFACKTNLPSNTAFRGFGVPQASIAMDTIIDKVAEQIEGSSAEKIREMHLYSEGDSTPYGHILEYCTIRRCWEECLAKSNYSARKLAVDKFNGENKWKKRGIAVTPTRHNVGVPMKCFNQAAAMVMVYLDGSVSLSHGGIEVGQGLHTRMIQIASRVLQIPVARIYVTDTSTDKIPNSIPTAASVGSDYFGMATMLACQKLKKRLEPYVQSNPTGKWDDWITAAYYNRTNLTATGFYNSLDVGINFATGEGNICNYVCFGVACSEVELDCLTGDHTVLRTDIVMDVGESLNPAIDIGQIEGAFMQGYGLFTLEEHLFSTEGRLMTNGPATYKIPTVSDIPRQFNVSLLRGAPNPKAVFSSKAVGEPPFFLAGSVFFAIKEGVRAARIDNGLSPVFQLDSPATVERIHLACGPFKKGFK